ncbi:hypothetical protein J3F83DRAFT_754329 [Trichoderma novae-zelandiae]
MQSMLARFVRFIPSVFCFRRSSSEPALPRLMTSRWTSDGSSTSGLPTSFHRLVPRHAQATIEICYNCLKRRANCKLRLPTSQLP